MTGDNLKQDQRGEDFNRVSQHRDRPAANERTMRSPKQKRPIEQKWGQGQPSPGFNRATLARKRLPKDRSRPVTQAELKRREADWFDRAVH